MPTVITPLDLTKPTVGGDKDTWGTYTNENWDKVNAIHTSDGTGTSVGMHVGTGKVLKIDGGTSDVILPGQLDTQTLRLRGGIDASKIVDFTADLITTLTTRTLKAPDRSGTIATEELLAERVGAAVPTGTTLHGYWGGTPPAGFVFADGRTIGDALSGALGRANDDTEALFTRFWTYNDNTRFSLHNPDGSAAVRGASAAADFDDHKQIALPNHAGRVAAGRDNMSGATSGTWLGANIVGVTAGSITHTLTAAENAAHTHGVSDSGHSHSVLPAGGGTLVTVGGGSAVLQDVPAVAGTTLYVAGASTTSDTTGITGTQSSGSGLPHNNVQPTIICDVVIAL